MIGKKAVDYRCTEAEVVEGDDLVLESDGADTKSRIELSMMVMVMVMQVCGEGRGGDQTRRSSSPDVDFRPTFGVRGR